MNKYLEKNSSLANKQFRLKEMYISQSKPASRAHSPLKWCVDPGQQSKKNALLSNKGTNSKKPLKIWNQKQSKLVEDPLKQMISPFSSKNLVNKKIKKGNMDINLLRRSLKQSPQQSMKRVGSQHLQNGLAASQKQLPLQRCKTADKQKKAVVKQKIYTIPRLFQNQIFDYYQDKDGNFVDIELVDKEASQETQHILKIPKAIQQQQQQDDLFDGIQRCEAKKVINVTPTRNAERKIQAYFDINQLTEKLQNIRQKSPQNSIENSQQKITIKPDLINYNLKNFQEETQRAPYNQHTPIQQKKEKKTNLFRKPNSNNPSPKNKAKMLDAHNQKMQSINKMLKNQILCENNNQDFILSSKQKKPSKQINQFETKKRKSIGHVDEKWVPAPRPCTPVLLNIKKDNQQEAEQNTSSFLKEMHQH